jgi:hypothetical protein
MDGLCKEGAVGKAFGCLFEQMLSIGVVPNIVTYNTLINGLCNMGKLGKKQEGGAATNDFYRS